MNENEFKSALKEAFRINSLESILDDKATDTLCLFAKILVETNKSFNLTSITDEKEVILKHFVDCAAVIKHIPVGATVTDVGCGAGFPSLPIAILRPDASVTSLDSTAKKINFIKSTAKELGLCNITAITTRAEDFAKAHREQFDVSISRAVARMNILSELCLPLTRVGGKYIAMKGSRGEEEYIEAKGGIEKLGGKLSAVDRLTLEYDGQVIEREIYVVAKASRTPTQYPRNFSQISKKPL